MKAGYLYYASDKAVYDALVQHNFKNADIREIFLSRGILISDDTSREDVAFYFSTLNHDYYDHQRIAKIFGEATRKERTALTRLENSFSHAKFDYVGQELKKRLEAEGAEVKCEWKGKSLEITIRYEEYNSNKSEFKQTVEREGTIEVDLSGSEALIRYTNNRYISGAKEGVLDLLSKEVAVGEKFGFNEISLKTIVNSESRTDFFRRLINSLSGYKSHDVSDVYVYNPKVVSAQSSATDIGVHITKVSLRGEGVLSSAELDALFKAGFYINRVVWTCVAHSETSDIFEIDAQFSNPEDCEGFAYVVKGVYKYNSKGTHNKNRVGCDEFSDKKMLRLIESGANKALQEVKGGGAMVPEEAEVETA